MKREHALGRKAHEQAVVDHRLRAGVTFLARLEDQVGDAVEIARGVEVTRSREQHCRVSVMAAAMHAPVVARAPGGAGFLLHRQRVHVGPQRDTAAARVAAPGNDGDDTGAPDAGVMLDAERAQVIADEASGAMLLEAQLGVCVQVAADLDQFVGPAANGVDRRGTRHGDESLSRLALRSRAARVA